MLAVIYGIMWAASFGYAGLLCFCSAYNTYYSCDYRNMAHVVVASVAGLLCFASFWMILQTAGELFQGM